MTSEYNELSESNEKDFSVEAFMKDENDGFPDKSFSLRELSEDNGLEIDDNGHQFFNLKTLLRWKKTMNREKDRPDIDLIESILQNGGSKKVKRSSKKHTKKHSKKHTKKHSKKRTRKN